MRYLIGVLVLFIMMCQSVMCSELRWVINREVETVKIMQMLGEGERTLLYNSVRRNGKYTGFTETSTIDEIFKTMSLKIKLEMYPANKRFLATSSLIAPVGKLIKMEKQLDIWVENGKTYFRAQLDIDTNEYAPTQIGKTIKTSIQNNSEMDTLKRQRQFYIEKLTEEGKE